MASNARPLARGWAWCRARWPAVGLLLALVRPINAAEPEATELARQHFQRGYGAAQRGELDLAVTEFERAYAASPNPSVLFNLGQAYASAGRALEAVDTLERYLALSGDAVQPGRRALVESLIAYHSRSLGELALDISPTGAEVTVDARSVGAAPLAAPLRLTRGAHVVSVSLSGYEPQLAPVEVRAGERLPLRVALRPSAPSARVRIRCAIPDVAVAVDGRVAGNTPLDSSISVLPGARTVELSRPGYVTVRRVVEVRAGDDVEVPCSLRPIPPTPAFARLSLSHPLGTRALLDEQPFTGQAVPAGRHRLVVSGDGFERAERTVTLRPAAVTKISLVPRRAGASASLELAERQRTQRVVAYVAGGTGLALGAAALGIYFYNNGRHTAWQRDADAFKRDFARDPSLAPPSRLDALLEDERAIRTRDAVALAGGVLGGALVATAVGLYFTAQSEDAVLTVTGGVAPGGPRSALLPSAVFAGTF
jgi:hypothetical protein